MKPDRQRDYQNPLEKYRRREYWESTYFHAWHGSSSVDGGKNTRRGAAPQKTQAKTRQDLGNKYKSKRLALKSVAGAKRLQTGLSGPVRGHIKADCCQEILNCAELLAESRKIREDLRKHRREPREPTTPTEGAERTETEPRNKHRERAHQLR